MVVVVVDATFALVKLLPSSEHVHYRSSPENYHVRKRGTESKHSRKFVAMAHLRKRTARQMDYKLNYRTKTCREALTWTKFNKINSCVTKARDIAWDAVVRVYTQLIINSPSWPTNSCKSLMGNRCKGTFIRIQYGWLFVSSLMPTNHQLHHLTLKLFHCM